MKKFEANFTSQKNLYVLNIITRGYCILAKFLMHTMFFLNKFHWVFFQKIRLLAFERKKLSKERF